MNEQVWWKQKFPLILTSLIFVMTLYILGWAWVKVSSLFVTHAKGELTFFMPSIFGENPNVSIFFVIVTGVFSIFGWLLSTRVTFYQSKQMRAVYFMVMGAAIWGSLAAYGMSEAQNRMLPFFEGRIALIETDTVNTNGILEEMVFGQLQGFYLMIVIIPVLILFFVSYFFLNKYVEHDAELKKEFFSFTWKGKLLQKFSKMEQVTQWPDIELGESSKNKEMVVLPGGDRTLNTMIVGSIGTGKTAALALPMINQDLHHMVRYIKDYKEMFEREDFRTEEIGGRYLSGLSVIDPSNDLCQKTLKLVKAHNIPEEVITYINPLDPNTPSINAMRGPVDKVAEVFAQVIAGLNDSKDGGNFFFEQAQRNHLKHYIYLLKLHDTEKEVTLDMLLDMYNNPQLVHLMHIQLKKTIPSNIDEIEERDERNYWKIVQGIDEWFELNLLPKMVRSGPNMVPEFGDNGEPLYYDAKEEHVQGLRNILNDIGANPLIRRVLFGKSEFDFDRHMEIGGILLVNTAKGELVNLARVLGKIVLMNLQNATFRRLPNVSSFHHILVDEAPDYLYNSFREFPAQSRKYKVIITTLQQTIAQLADQFGEHYMTTLIGTMRNRMVYGDVPGYDADYFSKMFGEKYVYEEGQSEMSVSPLQEDPVSRSGSSYSKVRDSAMSGGDIMFQEAFQCAVKLVVNNKPMPVVQIKANFVPREEFEVAKYLVDDEAADIWLSERRKYGLKIEKEVELAIDSIEQTEELNEQYYADPLDEEMVERAINIEVPKQPSNEVVYRQNELSHEPAPSNKNNIVRETPLTSPAPNNKNDRKIEGTVLEPIAGKINFLVEPYEQSENTETKPKVAVISENKKPVKSILGNSIELFEDSPSEPITEIVFPSAKQQVKGDYQQSELSEDNQVFIKELEKFVQSDDKPSRESKEGGR